MRAAGRFQRMFVASALCLGLSPAIAAQGASDFEELDRQDKKTADAAEDPAAQMREDLRQARERTAGDVGDSLRRKAEDAQWLSARMQAQYDELLASLARQREELRRLVQRQWTEFHESTAKTWVDYNARGDSLSQVNFEQGQVEIEVLVPVEEATGGRKKTAVLSELDDKERKKLQELAEAKVLRQTQKVLSEKEAPTTEILKDQIKAPDGKAVTPANAREYVQKTLAPKIQIEEKPIVAQDGKPRLKAKVRIELVPEHLKIRAKRYEARTDAAAGQYGLDPALLMAVMHTESEFNPRARSQAPAFGLMQLMPKSAAREAHQYLYKVEKILTPDELYDPDVNILLGATYLHMLRTRYYPKVKDAANQRTLMIASYNCGPSCIRKNVLSKGDPDSMTNAELVALIRRAAPKETQEYVPRVQGRLETYKKLQGP